MSPESPRDVIRSVGIMERYHVLLGELGFDSCVAIAGRFVTSSGEPLTKEMLYPALQTMIRQHAGLGVQITPGPTLADVPQFVRLPDIDLDTVVDFVQDSQDPVDELLRAQLGKPIAFGMSAPLWRVAVVNGSTVVFAFHHVIADGQSGPALLATLQHALNAVDNQVPDGGSTKVPVPPTLPLAGPPEAYVNISLSWSTLFSELYKLAVPKSWLPSTTAWTGNPVPPSPSLAMHVQCWSISAPQSAAMLTQCRANETTLTAFLYTFLLGVLSPVLQEQCPADAAAHPTANVAVPVSLRRLTGTPPLALCDQVSTVHFYAPLQALSTDGSDFSWADARKFRDELHSSIPGALEVLGELRLLFRWNAAEAYFRGLLGKKRTSSLALSNLGRFPVEVLKPEPEASRWTLSDVYFAQCDVVRGAAMKVNVVGSPEGTTNVSFTWGESALDLSLAQSFIENVKTTLGLMFDP